MFFLLKMNSGIEFILKNICLSFIIYGFEFDF